MPAIKCVVEVGVAPLVDAVLMDDEEQSRVSLFLGAAAAKTLSLGLPARHNTALSPWLPEGKAAPFRLPPAAVSSVRRRSVRGSGPP
jgi:hypothetical protein